MIKKSGNIMLMSVFISMGAISVFFTLSFFLKEYQKNIYSLELGKILEQTLQSGMKEAEINYFDTKSGTGNIFFEEIYKNKNSKFKIDSGIYFGGNNFLERTVNKIGEIDLRATKMKNEINKKINSFGNYELRLIGEEREKNRRQNTLEKLKKLEISFESENGNKINTELEIIQIRWILNEKNKIETHRIYLKKGQKLIFGDLENFGEKDNVLNFPSEKNFGNTEFKGKKFEYIFIFKTKSKPIYLKIKGLGENGKYLKLPSSDLKIIGKGNLGNSIVDFGGSKKFEKTFEKSIKIYDNFDKKDFDYKKYFIF